MQQQHDSFRWVIRGFDETRSACAGCRAVAFGGLYVREHLLEGSMGQGLSGSSRVGK